MDKDSKYKKLFSKNLNYYMALKNKTQTDIINDLDINKSAISSWCNGTRLPRMNKVQLLADYLNINVSDLIEGSCDNNNYFEFISEDDSMYPILDIEDGGILQLNWTVSSQICYDYLYGEIINTTTNSIEKTTIKLNGKNTIRKFVLDKEKNVYQLIAKNTCCKTIDIPADNLYDTVQIIGKVVKAENESAFK